MQIHDYDVEEIFELLTYHEQNFMLFSKFGSKSAHEDAEELEPEPKERTVTVVKLTDGLGLTEAGVNVFEDVGWKEQQAAPTGQGIVRMLCWLGSDMQEKKRSLSARLQCLIC